MSTLHPPLAAVPTTGFYARVLGNDWLHVAEAVRGAHSDGRPLQRVGTFQVVRGPGRLARLLAMVARLPPSCSAAATVLLIEPLGDGGEQWIRSFAGQRLVTLQRAGSTGTLYERIGAVEFCFQLVVEDGTLVYRQLGAALKFGPWSIPLPRGLQPRVSAREAAVDRQRTHVRVEVALPLVGALISYDGILTGESP